MQNQHTLILENNRCRAELSDGRLTGLFDRTDGTNLADARGKTGTACFTLSTDDIRTMPHAMATPYEDRTAHFSAVEAEGDNKIRCTDEENRVTVTYTLESDGISLDAESQNPNMSEFGLNLDLNFLGKKGNDYHKQLLPSSPYTSADGRYTYVILTRPNGKFVTAVAQTPCDGWKFTYSPFACGHFIFNLQFLASFDRVYHGSDRKTLRVRLQFADSLEEAFAKIQQTLGVPLCRNILSGGFDGYAMVQTIGKADSLRVEAPDGSVQTLPLTARIPLSEFGFYTVTPICDGKPGLNTTVWSGGSSRMALFDLSCDGIRKPYHGDRNLCEGGCFLWAMLFNEEMRGTRRYDHVIQEELRGILGKDGIRIPRRTIVPVPENGFAAYHICESTRVQEQFFGVSILLEAYRVYKDEELLETAISALNELVENYMQNGMVFNGHDYTTVCCPMIPLVDMTLFLKSRHDTRAEIFERAARQMANFLLERGMNFPTEGEISELTDPEYEDGAISCTALALLYYCMHMEHVPAYEKFAKEVLDLHRAWMIYTPDARMQGSSFRWWETIWEGDGEGPAICAGHAWTIWTAEAMFDYGVLTHNDRVLLESWNSWITNFSKTQPDGSMYSCYEADFIRGGGYPWVKSTLLQLEGEDTSTRYEIAHDYPHHIDSSLSRYAWARAAETWLQTAALLWIDGQIVPIHAHLENGVWTTDKDVRQIYIGDLPEPVKLSNPSLKRI